MDTRKSGKKFLDGLFGVSVILMSARMGGVAANFVFNLILARFLSPADFGNVAVVISTTMLASILTTLNIESGSIQHLVHARETGDLRKAAGFIIFSRRLLMLSTPIIIFGYVLAASLLSPDAFNKNQWIYLIGAFAIPTMGWLRIFGRHANVLSHQIAGSLPHLFFRPTLLLIFIAASILLSGALVTDFVVFAYVVSAIIAAMIQFYLLYPHFRFVRENIYDFGNKAQWLKTGLLLSPTLITQEFFQDGIVALAAFSLPSSEIAKLTITLRLIGFVNFGLAAVNMAIGPKLAASMARDDRATRDHLLNMSTHLKLWPGLLITGIIIIFGEYILLLFGAVYAKAAPALNWLIVIPLLMAVLGPNEILLNTSGLQKYIFRSALVTIAVSLLLVPLGGAYYGLLGVVWGAVLSFAVWEVLIYISVRQRLGLDASLLGTLYRLKKGRE